MRTWPILLAFAVMLANLCADRTAANVKAAREFTVAGLAIGMTEQEALKAMPTLDDGRPKVEVSGVTTFYSYKVAGFRDVRIGFHQNRAFRIVVEYSREDVSAAGGASAMRAWLKQELGDPEPPRGKGSSEDPVWDFDEVDRVFNFGEPGDGVILVITDPEVMRQMSGGH